MTDLAIYEGKKVVLMKSGIVHWVTDETGTKLQDHLGNQTSHTFIRMAELGITINTAEMEGVYTQKEYEKICRVKGGEWQCAWGKWHPKKGECKCKQEADEERRRIQKQERDAAENRPLTEEEKEAKRESLLKMGEMAALNRLSFAMIRYRKGNRDGNKIRRSTIVEWEEKNGRTADLSDLATQTA